MARVLSVRPAYRRGAALALSAAARRLASRRRCYRAFVNIKPEAPTRSVGVARGRQYTVGGGTVRSRQSFEELVRLLLHADPAQFAYQLDDFIRRVRRFWRRRRRLLFKRRPHERSPGFLASLLDGAIFLVTRRRTAVTPTPVPAGTPRSIVTLYRAKTRRQVCAATTRLLRLDPDLLDHLAPGVELRLHEGAGRGRRAGTGGVEADLAQPLDNIRLAQHLV